VIGSGATGGMNSLLHRILLGVSWLVD